MISRALEAFLVSLVEEASFLAEQVGWGISGSGTAAANIARALRSMPGARMLGVTSRTLDGAHAFAKRFGIQNVHASVEELASDRDVDIVFIAAPNHLHAPQALALLRRGKAVLCEKPFALGAREANEVASAARAAGRFCMEAMWTRFLPATREMLARIAAGDVGEPRLLVTSLGWRITAADSPSRHDPRQGGGALLDLGVYPLSLSSSLFGKPVHVAGSAKLDAAGLDVAAELSLTHARGAASFLTCSFDSQLANDAWIFGSEGRIHVHPPMHRPEAFTLERFDDRPARERAKGRVAAILDTPLGQRANAAFRGLSAAVARGGGRTFRFPAAGNGYGYELDEVMRCLREKLLEHPRLTLAESVSILETTDRLRDSFAAAPAHEKGAVR